MIRPGIAGAAPDPDWLVKTLKDLQHQIDQLRASLGGAQVATPGSGPVISAVLVRNMDGTYAPGTTVTGSDFSGDIVPVTITTQTF